MAIDLSIYHIVPGDDTELPTKLNGMMDDVETAVNSGLSDIETNLTTLTGQITTEIDEATGALSLQITGELDAAVAVVEGYRDQAAVSATTATTQAGIATTKANEGAASASLAEGHKDSAANSALAVSEIAASLGDIAARVMPIIEEKGLPAVTAMTFNGVTGWEGVGNQSFKNEDRPTGRYLLERANATDAWAANKDGVPSAEGDYYWNTTFNSIHKLTTSNASTVVRRAGGRDLPSENITFGWGVGSTARVVMFDLTDPEVPPVIDFTCFGNSMLGGNPTPDSKITGLVWGKGKDLGTLFVTKGAAGISGVGLFSVDFLHDKATWWTGIAKYTYAGRISNRIAGAGYKQISSDPVSSGFINGAAGIDAGGIVVGTDGGVSIVKPDETVKKSSTTAKITDVKIMNGRVYHLILSWTTARWMVLLTVSMLRIPGAMKPFQRCPQPVSQG